MYYAGEIYAPPCSARADNIRVLLSGLSTRRCLRLVDILSHNHVRFNSLSPMANLGFCDEAAMQGRAPSLLSPSFFFSPLLFLPSHSPPNSLPSFSYPFPLPSSFPWKNLGNVLDSQWGPGEPRPQWHLYDIFIAHQETCLVASSYSKTARRHSFKRAHPWCGGLA